MEHLFSKHPEMCHKILRLIDNKSLTKLREVNRNLLNIIDNEKIYQNRFMSYMKDLFSEHINENEIQSRMQRGQSFLHLATVTGKMKLVKWILLKTEDKNPADKFGKTPLHYASEYGHTEIFRIIFDTIGKELFFCVNSC